MSSGDRQNAVGTGNAASVHDRRWEVRVVSVKFSLRRAVGIHLEEGLRIDLPAVVVVPARVDDASVVEKLRIIDGDLVEGESTHEPALSVAGVEVRDFGAPAVGNLRASGRPEEEIAVGEVDRLDIGDALSRGNLPRLLRIDVVFVEVKIVLV